MKRALVSVFDKTGIVELCRELKKMDFEIVSTGGTAKTLQENGVAVTQVSALTGFPEILDGRVKTLHPRIHAGILASQQNAEHQKTLKAHQIEPFALVVVNLYPFEQTIQNKNASWEDVIENIDIGGPTLIRAAAKNHESVGIIVDPADYELVLGELQKTDSISLETRQQLAAKAFSHTGYYDSLIGNVLSKRFLNNQWPSQVSLGFKKLQECRYGENPHQAGAVYQEPLAPSHSVVFTKQLQGKEMSFNNFLDANAGVQLCQEFSEPTAVVIKHGNPCGVATNETIEEALERAVASDPVSAFGGIIVLNRPCSKTAAQKATSFFNEIVIAPSFEPDALSVLETKKNLRVLELSALGKTEPKNEWDFKRITGGLLLQSKDQLAEKKEDWKVVSQTVPTDLQWNDLAFAYKIAKHVKSNAIVLAKDHALIGVGAGQMSRIDSTEIAVKKANGRQTDAVLASDAFFPFRDNLDLAAQAGIKAIIHPGGSVQDAEVIKAANEQGVALVFTGVRHFRH